ncbi:DUF2252 family protein [Bdellovibrio sp. NC01]|uniref:DUF2252 family protein n=1 Tax=Bdellovibrio sp. NC01 TaxID=2220073 RepID=UPI00115BCF39|nr:DUF2252 family protein [Bdellovibrio sp. NC01]
MKSILTPARTHMVMNILTAFALLAPASAFAAGEVCTTIFGATDSQGVQLKIDGTWRKYDGSLFMAFRANAPHFWNWLRDNQIPLLQPRGTVTGDPHIQNFGDVALKDGGRKYALIDVDDSGMNAPLAGDFLRYFVGNQISPFKVDAKDLFKAYVDGVSGKKMDKPDYLKQVEDKSDKDFADRQLKRISKLSNGRNFSPDAEVTPIPNTSAEIRALYEQVLPAFQNEMTGYEILDVGYRTKDSGGSQGLPRFWFLLEKKGERHVFEFKMETDPATALYTHQPDALTRFKNIADTYRPSQEVLGPYKFLQIGDKVFLLRERLYSYVNLDPALMTADKDKKDAQEMSLYIANKMGLAHGQQQMGGELKKRLEADGAYDSFTSLAVQYITNISKANQ